MGATPLYLVIILARANAYSRATLRLSGTVVSQLHMRYYGFLCPVQFINRSSVTQTFPGMPSMTGMSQQLAGNNSSTSRSVFLWILFYSQYVTLHFLFSTP